MKSKGLQALIADVFRDEASKSKFTADPASFIANYNITEQEKTAVMKTHASIGLVNNGSAQLEAAIKPTVNWCAPLP